MIASDGSVATDQIALVLDIDIVPRDGAAEDEPAPVVNLDERDLPEPWSS